MILAVYALVAISRDPKGLRGKPLAFTSLALSVVDAGLIVALMFYRIFVAA